jgi:hypothetical protein
VSGKKENNFLAQPKNVVGRGTDVWAGCFFFTFLGGTHCMKCFGVVIEIRGGEEREGGEEGDG